MGKKKRGKRIEDYVLRVLAEHHGLSAESLRRVTKQILIVQQVLPHHGAYEDQGKPPADCTDLRFVGTPSPSSDKLLKSAILRFRNGTKLRAPSYDATRHQIVFERPLDTLEGMLLSMKDSPAIYCWIGFWPGHTYADMHCELATAVP